MPRCIALGPTLASISLLVFASVASANTFGAPNGNETFADLGFSQTVNGVSYSWDLRADRDTVAGTSVLDASYSAEIDDGICRGGDQDGQPGFRSISFFGESSVRFIVGPKLGSATAGARVTGVEDTFDSCTNADTVVTKTFAVRFAAHATSGPTTFPEQQCIDFGDGVLMNLTGTTTIRDAAGVALVNHRAFAAVGSIGHHQWSSVPDPSCV